MYMNSINHSSYLANQSHQVDKVQNKLPLLSEITTSAAGAKLHSYVHIC